MPVVKHSLKLVAADCIGCVSSSKINVKLAIAAGEHHGIRKLVADTSGCACVRADYYKAEQNQMCWLRHLEIITVSIPFSLHWLCRLFVLLHVIEEGHETEVHV